MSKDLPSYEDFFEDKDNLPSVDDFITEENAEELPSVEDYIEIEESTQTIEDADGNTFAEVQDIVPPWPELVRMINDVRADIPDIPEVKYYDKELEELAEQISNLPEVRYYDREVEAICDQVDLVREQIKGLPEVKYYDEQVDAIEDRIDTLQTEVANLPEVKYYDAEITAICEAIDAVKASIPKFPKWINEVNEVPDFSWIGKTFSVIEDDFIKVSDKIEGLRGKVDFDLDQLSEDIETKHFNSTIKIENDISNLSEKVDTRIDEEKDKIWKELRSSSLKMWEYHKEFKDDDRKLKKQIIGEYNTLKQNINKELKEINYTSTKTDELLLKYFTELREEISGLPEVKYYDKDIDYVKSDIKGLYKIVEEIKSSQKQLKEEQQLLAETNVPLGEDPPETNNSDPLTPLNQDFVTLDQLQKHYKIFVERVQYQLSSIGGGGAGFIKDLDDVDITGLENNYILQYDSSVSKWKTVANSGGGVTGAGGTWATFDSNTGITTTKKVKIQNNLEVTGVTTSTGGFVGNVTGNASGTAGGLTGTPDITVRNITGVAATFTGVLTYEDVTNIDSIGLITARSGIKVLDEGIDVTGVSTISTGVGTVHVGVGSTTLLVDGDARVTGILTVGSSSLTLDGVNNIVNVGTALTLGHTQGIQFHSQNLHASGFDVNSINASGISTISTGVGTVHVGVGSTALLVEGDARVTGILTIGAGSITLDPDAKQIKGIDEIIIGTATTIAIKQDSKGEVTFQDSAGKEASVGIGTTVSINTSGIITASSFVGSVTGTASNASGATGDFSIADKIVHTGDTNTAIRFPADDTVTVETSGSEALRVDSSGRLLLGTTTEGATLADNFTVADSGNCGITIRSGSSNYGSIYFSDATSGSDEYRGQIEYNHNTDILRIYSGGAAVLRIDPGKLEVIGHTETDTLNASGVITASSFRGDGSQLTNIISGVGIQSASTRIGTGFTDINFTGVGITVVGSGTTVTVDIPSSTITRQLETSSGVTTDFTVTGGYTVGLLDVFVNGVKQINGSDFTATDGSTVTMTPNVTDGDVVEFQKYDKLNIAGITSVTNATNAYNIVGGVSFATSAGIATALNSDSSINTSGIITASQLAISGLSTSKDLLVTGITSATNIIEIKSNDSTPGRIDLYCETNNAHYARLQAPEHGDFGGNITVKLPASTGTLLLSDGSGASLTSLNASNLGSGTIPDARFPATLPAISGQNLTGIVTGITAGSNITVLESPSGNFIITATGGGGGDTVSINASAGDILSASSGEISADDAGSDKLVFWDDSESKLTYLTAGSGLSISGTTITASGGGGSSGVEIENNGTSVGTGITAINFSTNVTATASGGIATVTASGGGGGSDGPSSVMMGMIF